MFSLPAITRSGHIGAWHRRSLSDQLLHQGNIIVRAEFNLYSTKDEKLIWSGETDTVYSKDFQKLGKQYAEMLVKQLKKDKVIGKK